MKIKMGWKNLENLYIYVQGGGQRTAEAIVQGQSESKIESHHVRNAKVSGNN